MPIGNRLFLTDSYKITHWKQYPPNTTNVYSYFESRGGQYEKTLFFGLQYILREYMEKPITMQEVLEAEMLYDLHLGKGCFNRNGWDHIVADHGGNIPLRIKAVPEGSIIPTGNVLMTVENTCDACYWLTNFFETLLVQVWYPTTVATISKEMKNVITAALEKSGDPGLVDFKLHDFGCRGVSSMETALIGGMAHLVNFKGTDTVPGLIGAKRYYDEECAGFSIPAAEHSTITSWGQTGEYEAYKNMLDQYPSGLVAVVSDSYNIYDACSVLWGSRLREQVLGRDGCLIVRPDSGIPHEVVPKVLDILGEKFGYTVNQKFFKVLDPHVRVIQGDGIEPSNQAIEKIYQACMQAGWSADNVAFGSGGGLLQKMNRDTQKFAFKCSSIVRGGNEVDVFKQPVGASWKASKKGRLMLTHYDGEYMTRKYDPTLKDALVLVYENGQLKRNWKFKEVRDRVCA